MSNDWLNGEKKLDWQKKVESKNCGDANSERAAVELAVLRPTGNSADAYGGERKTGSKDTSQGKKARGKALWQERSRQ